VAEETSKSGSSKETTLSFHVLSYPSDWAPKD
jgi:hypothetical protein